MPSKKVPSKKGVRKKRVVKKSPAKPRRAKKTTPAAEKVATTKRFQSAASQHRFSLDARRSGRTIGFVPTMGAFHEGHLALIARARAQNDLLVTSVFVNPLQFSPGEDFERYPSDLARDMDLAREHDVDAVFVPDPAEMYPSDFAARITMGAMAEKMCGKHRPGHFDGVCTVVMKLLGIVQPDRIYLGEKDAQQLLLLRRMVADFNMAVRVVGCPTVRDKDGLALSSRNQLLTPAQRAEAPRLYEALRLAQRLILVEHVRDARQLQVRMQDHIMQDDAFRIDYIATVDQDSLDDREVLTGRTLIAVAARLGKTRLIDNIMINVPGGQMAEGVGRARR